MAEDRGIRVLLDLVPGHTSEEHAWFRESGRAAPNEYSGRYIWTDYWIRGITGYPYISGECERNGVYMLNFFKCQPALNYGFLNPTENDAAPPTYSESAPSGVVELGLRQHPPTNISYMKACQCPSSLGDLSRLGTNPQFPRLCTTQNRKNTCL